MRRILFVVLCVVVVTYGQNRGSRRFTPSPFLEGQDLGFLPSRYTTARPGSGHRANRPRPVGRPGVSRRRPTTPIPALGANDIDDGFGAVSAAKEGVRRVVPVVTAKRQPQRTRTAVRRRRPSRVQTVTTTAPDVQEAVQTTYASVSTTARPARLRTASKAGKASTLSLQRQVEVRKKQVQSSTRRLKGRRVKKIKRIIHPESDDGDDDNEKKVLQESREEADEETSVSSEGSDEATSTTTQSPVILRRQKKVFRGRGQQRGRGGSSRRQFSSRRRVVTQAPATLTEADPTTVPTVVISTSSPFEPFLQEENEVDDSKSEGAGKKSTNEANSGITFTQLTSSAGGEVTHTSSSSSSSASSSSATATVSNSQSDAKPSLNEDSSDNEVESSAGEDVGSNEATVQVQGVRRPASRGSVRSSVRGSSTVIRTRGRQGASRGSDRGRARGSGRQTLTSSSSSSSSSNSVTGTGSISSSSRGTSRRKFVRRRRPSTSGSVNTITSRTPVTTTTTTAATFTTASPSAVIDISSGPATEQTFQTNRLTSTNSLESEAPSRGQGAFNFGPTTGVPLPSAGPVTTFGGFRPVTSSGSFQRGPGAATRFGASPRPVSTTFPPTFQPTTPAVPAQVFGGSSGNQGFGQSTPESATLLSNTFGGSDFRPTSTQEPVAFFPSGSRGVGSGRPSFGSFSFGNAAGSSSSSSGGVSSFNSITTTARPVTFRPTTAKTATTTFGFGFGNSATVTEDRRFGSQSVSASGGFRPSSFTTSRPAPTFNTNTDTNVRISSNGAFSFGTGLTNPPVSGPDFGAIDLQTTTPNSAFPTVRPFTSFDRRPTSTSARAPAVLSGGSRFFGAQPVSTFTHGAVHPAPATSSGSFSFGTAVTEASTLVQSLATSPATPATTTPTSRPQTFRPVTERSQIFQSANSLPVSHTSQQVGQTFVSHRQRQGTDQFQHQDFGPSSSSFSSSSSPSQGSSGSGRPANAGRSFGSSSSSSSNSFFDTGRVTGFEFQQENGIITRSSHLRGFDTRLPKFHENVVISDPVFSSKDIKPGFTCEGRPYGYYADEANDCRIFHICQPVDVSSISTFYTRYSFFCGSETRFDQSKLSCLHDKDAMPCSESASWLFRNDEFGVQQETTEEERFLSEVQGAPATV